VGTDRRPLAADVLDVYRRVRGERGESLAGIDLIYAVQTDLSMRGPAIRLAEHHARHQPLTFMYLFDWTSPAEHGALGSCHALDVPFTFGALDVPGITTLTGAGEAPERLAEDMMDAWIAFARSGRPTTARLGSWSGYEAGTRTTMVLGAKSGPVSAPREAERVALAGVIAAQTP
jgi:para-nitrobenzyl esterase